MEEIVKQFASKYDIYQACEYTGKKISFDGDWDLFFWSDRGWNKKDFMTHFSLTFNDNRSPEQNMKLLEEIISLVETIEYENISCRIQYDAVIDEKKVGEDAKTICENLVGKFIEYCGMTGKIKVVREENGIFYVENCEWLDDIMNRVDPDDYESLQYFERVLRQSGIIDALETAGVHEGDTVNVLDIEFDFVV